MKSIVWAELKRKVNIVVLGLLVLFLAVGIAVFVKPTAEYRFEGSYTPTKGVTLREEPLYQGISLTPGVYQIELSYETEVPMGFLCNAKDDTVAKGNLLTNGENLYAGRGETGFLMWLFESTDNLEINLSYEGEAALTTGNLVIRETRLLGSMMITAGLFFLLLFAIIFVYRCREKRMPFTAAQKKAMYGVAAISLMASLPFLLGVSFNSADLTFHLHRIEGIMDGLKSGRFPVRIEPEWLHGHGYACGIFYCNILLYFPAFLRLVGFPITFSYNIYCVLLNIATAWIAYGSFGKIFKDRTIGLACSALYTLAGMRIFKSIMTGGPGENGAMMFLPLLIYGFYAVLTYETTDRRFKNSWLPISIGYAGLLQTHLLTFELTVFVTLLVCVICIKKVVQKERFLMLVKSALVAIFMSAWFLVPFLDYYIHENVQIKYTSGRTIQEVGLGLRDLFLREDPTGVGLFLAGVLLVFVILWIAGKCKKGDLNGLGKISAGIGSLMMVMSLQIFPWNQIQESSPFLATFISSIQFPYRFLGWGNTFCILLVGYLLWYTKQNHKKWAYAALMVGTILSLTTFSVALLEDISKNQGTYTLYNVEGMGRGYISGAEYVIRGTQDTELTYREPVVSEGLSVSQYEKGSLQAVFTCENRSDSEGTVDLPLLLYRGYQAKEVESGEMLSLSYGENNTVMVSIPAGFNGEVLVKHTPLWYWRVGEAVTVLCYLWMAFTCIKRKNKGISK